MARRNQLLDRFSLNPKVTIRRSKFDRSHEYKTTFNADYLIPIYVDEALPGDTFIMDFSALVRMATPVFPIMDNIYLDTFFFAVPCRLVWDNWQRMMGERDNPDDSIDYVTPVISLNASQYIKPLEIGDYFGLPTNVSNIQFNALPFRAYNLIYNEWFRDENLIDSVDVNKGDGPDNLSDYQLLKRAKSHDYFTSALPWPQRGEGVSVPLGGTAPIVATGDNAGYFTADSDVYYTDGTTQGYGQTFKPYGPLRFTGTYSSGDSGDGATSGTNSTSITLDVQNMPDDFSRWANNGGSANSSDLSLDITGNFAADLSGATAATINSLREAFALQHFLEADARGGTRYTEILRQHFGVISPDARLQRPEYLGGTSTRININPVTQTGSTDSTSPQGNLAAYAFAAENSHAFAKSFVEHSIIIGLVNIRTVNTYQQGINRLWSRSDRYSYYWPEFAHLGEQAVLNKEIYAQGTAADDEVFGYMERYAEYRYYPSIITGAMRSNYYNPN